MQSDSESPTTVWDEDGGKDLVSSSPPQKHRGEKSARAFSFSGELPRKGLGPDACENGDCLITLTTLEQYTGNKVDRTYEAMDRCVTEMSEYIGKVEQRCLENIEAVERSVLVTMREYVDDCCKRTSQECHRNVKEVITALQPEAWKALQASQRGDTSSSPRNSPSRSSTNLPQAQKFQLQVFMEQSSRQMENVLRLLTDLQNVSIGAELRSSANHDLKNIMEQRLAAMSYHIQNHVSEVQEGWSKALKAEQHERQSSVSVVQNTSKSMIEDVMAKIAGKQDSSALSGHMTLLAQVDRGVKEVAANLEVETKGLQNTMLEFQQDLSKKQKEYITLRNELEALKNQRRRPAEDGEIEGRLGQLLKVAEERLDELMQTAEIRMKRSVSLSFASERASYASMQQDLMERTAELAEGQVKLSEALAQFRVDSAATGNAMRRELTDRISQLSDVIELAKGDSLRRELMERMAQLADVVALGPQDRID